MRVSAGLPTGMEGLTYPIPFSDPENVIRIAQAAEKFGYDSVWGNDHMTTQNYVRAEFPVPPRFWEPLVTYAFVLSETKTIKVGTGILVLPMRHDIVVAAKQIATLDHFGKGRLELGIGIGAYREEFKALQPDAKIDRGDIVDEGLQALNLLFKERVASFDGQYYKFKDVELYPQAVPEEAADLCQRQPRQQHRAHGEVGRRLAARRHACRPHPRRREDPARAGRQGRPRLAAPSRSARSSSSMSARRTRTRSRASARAR